MLSNLSTNVQVYPPPPIHFNKAKSVHMHLDSQRKIIDTHAPVEIISEITFKESRIQVIRLSLAGCLSLS